MMRAPWEDEKEEEEKKGTARDREHRRESQTGTRRERCLHLSFTSIPFLPLHSPHLPLFNSALHLHLPFSPHIHTLPPLSHPIQPFSFPPLLHPSTHPSLPSLHSPDGQPTLLPPDQVQELNVRSTGMLNSVQRLFSHHMIETFGCDYSTSGVTLEALQAKLKAFLELRTADGPRHDTYVVFYSGHTQRTGAWALAGGDSLRLEQLLEWWKEKNSGFTSRLILVLDTENSLPWVKEVRSLEGVYVAVQGAELAPAGDIEGVDAARLGDFTSEWVEFNCNPDSATQWLEKDRTVAAAYGVSKHWSDYTLHLPTGSDVAKHWKTHFPQATYPLVHLSNWCCGLNLLWLCGVCLSEGVLPLYSRAGTVQAFISSTQAGDDAAEDVRAELKEEEEERRGEEQRRGGQGPSRTSS
ncbi:unnamed protein product, partial [Coregonus sp. 'balchen']